MSTSNKNRGYTIIEVMIFLAVSGLMFVVAAVFVSGKQGKAEFKQSMNDINTQVQQVINDVSNGFYPSTNSFKCQANASGLNISAPSSNEQGSNLGCMFIGKAVQFGVANNGAGYNIYTIAGCQFNPCDSNVKNGLPPSPSTFTEAKPTVVDDSYSSGTVNGVNLTQQQTLQWGMQATAMYDYYGNSVHDISALGFLSSLPNQSASSLNSGSQSVYVYAINDSTSVARGGDQESDIIPKINSDLTNGSNLRGNPNFVICFNGGNSNYGALTIGGGAGQRLTSNIQISASPIQVQLGATGVTCN